MLEAGNSWKMGSKKVKMAIAMVCLRPDPSFNKCLEVADYHQNGLSLVMQ